MISRLLSQGGPFIYVILLLLLLALFFIIRAFILMNKDKAQSQKMIGLANDAGILSLVIGCFASVYALIDLFDMVESIGETRPDLFSAGLKVAMLTIIFGLFTLIIARIGILAYRWTLKPEVEA